MSIEKINSIENLNKITEEYLSSLADVEDAETIELISDDNLPPDKLMENVNNTAQVIIDRIAQEVGFVAGKAEIIMQKFKERNDKIKNELNSSPSIERTAIISRNIKEIIQGLNVEKGQA